MNSQTADGSDLLAESVLLRMARAVVVTSATRTMMLAKHLAMSEIQSLMCEIVAGLKQISSCRQGKLETVT